MSTFKLDLFKTSDLMTMFTRSFNDWAYGRTISIKKAGMATMTSIVSRIVSDNLPVTKYVSLDSKNQIVVGVIGALSAAIMKQGILRGSMDAVSADLTAEWLLKALGQNAKAAELGIGDTFDVSIGGPWTFGG